MTCSAPETSLARKKKKSKEKGNPRKHGVEATDASIGSEDDSGMGSVPHDPAEEAAVVDMATSEPETIDLDIEPGTDEEIAALLAEAIAAREAAAIDAPVPSPMEPEAEIIDLDIDLDVDEAPDALIAEALAFVESEDAAVDTDDDVGPALEAASEGSTRESNASDTAADGFDEDVDTTGGAPSEDSTSGAPSEEGASEEDPPLIGVAAVAALTQMRKEGLASVRGDLILDLGEATTPEQRDRLLAAAMAHSETQEAIYRLRTDTGHVRRGKAAIASAIFVLALFVAAVPPGIVVPEPPAQLREADRVHGVRITLLLQSEQIEAFRARNQRLPDALADVTAQLSEVRYVRSSSRLYQLIAYTPAGESIVFDSADPSPEFERLRRSWSTTRDGT